MLRSFPTDGEGIPLADPGRWKWLLPSHCLRRQWSCVSNLVVDHAILVRWPVLQMDHKGYPFKGFDVLVVSLLGEADAVYKVLEAVSCSIAKPIGLLHHLA